MTNPNCRVLIFSILRFVSTKCCKTQITMALEDAAKKQEEAELSLLSARKNAYKLLDDLKQELSNVKSPIKSAFLTDEWPKFGITDKR